jgi:hypothetical protein
VNAPRAMRGERNVAFASVLVLSSCVFVFGAGERRLAEQAAANDAAAAALRADQAALITRPSVEAQAARLRAALGATNRATNPALQAAAFVADAVRLAAERRTAITSFADDPSRPARGGGVGLRVELEGRYADVLATVRSFSTLRVPASLSLTALTRARSAGEATAIAAALRIELPRGTPSSADARTR